MCELYVLVSSSGDDAYLRAFRAVVELMVSAMAAAKNLECRVVEAGTLTYLGVKGSPEEIAAFADELNRKTGLAGFTVKLGKKDDLKALKELQRSGIVCCTMA